MIRWTLFAIAAAALGTIFAIPKSDAMQASKPADSQPASQPASQPRVPTEKVTIAGEEFTLEIAATEAARERGLMGRTEIAEHGGMIFIHPDVAMRGYWMANCPIDMDIIFLDAQGRIVATHAMKAEAPRGKSESREDYEARLKRYPSNRPAKFAIELKAGTIERLKISVGKTAHFDLERVRKLAVE